jgi:hypothetical protein
LGVLLPAHLVSLPFDLGRSISRLVRTHLTGEGRINAPPRTPVDRMSRSRIRWAVSGEPLRSEKCSVFLPGVRASQQELCDQTGLQVAANSESLRTLLGVNIRIRSAPGGRPACALRGKDVNISTRSPMTVGGGGGAFEHDIVKYLTSKGIGQKDTTRTQKGGRLLSECATKRDFESHKTRNSESLEMVIGVGMHGGSALRLAPALPGNPVNISTRSGLTPVGDWGI